MRLETSLAPLDLSEKTNNFPLTFLLQVSHALFTSLILNTPT